MAKKKREKIKFRNSATELWNDGRNVPDIAETLGITISRVEQLLAAGRKGFNTPEDLLRAKGL